ncbi:hypothetical protein ACUOFU_05245 [Microbacterium arabinogalactanolyticum]|uniref:hypothetical protein n=1 Tax=Microbacterium arabinogalactanolyticum TaxID=69365 RepID=UPI00404422FE
MYELNRARLVNVGPRGARYSDVTLDLSGLGEAISAQNLFDAPARRPAPSSLLLLENGGGKSVLLKLLFGVVLPGRRSTVGGASLDKFVLDGDTGHVVLEWMHVTTGELLVTGKAYQRRSRVSGDKDKVAEAWYSFRPGATLDLDTLPVAFEGRRRRLDGYKEAVEEANRIEPSTELSWLGDDQGRWRSHLRERGIEPDLFDIQRRMNVDEGEAAKTFKYSSSRDFVDWLLTMVTDPKDASSVADTFSQWATNLADREQMLVERDFLEGAIAGLEPLAGAQAAYQQAARNGANAVTTAEELAVALDARLSNENGSVALLASQLADARALLVTRTTERDNARALSNEIHRRRLQLELDDAERDKRQVKDELAGTELELHGWETIPTVEERDQAAAIAAQLAAQIAEADQDAAPALERRDQAAARLLAKYHAEAADAEAEARRHEGLLAEAKEAADYADQEHALALQSAARAAEKHRSATATVAGAAERIAQSSAAGLVPAGTGPAQVPTLTHAARAAHQELVDQLADREQAVVDLTQRETDATRSVAEASQTLQSASETADNALRDVRHVEDEAKRLARLPVLLEAMGGEDASADEIEAKHDEPGIGLTVGSLDEAADRLLTQLSADIEAHSDHIIEVQTLQHEDARVVDALGAGGLLPPRPDVERSIAVLGMAGVAAHPGWRYLHETAPADERAELIAAHPALVDGVVLVDATQLAAAEHALKKARLLPAAAIAVGSGAALLRPHSGLGDAESIEFVIEPTPALFDEEAAVLRREELLEQMARRGELLESFKEQRDNVATAHADLQRWRLANPPGQLERIRAAEAAAAAARETAARLHVGAQAEAAAAATEREQAQQAAANARAEERAAADRAALLASLAELVHAAAQSLQQLPEHEAQLREHQGAAVAALAKRKVAEQAQELNARMAEQARAQAQRHRAACSTVESTSGQPAAIVPNESVAELLTAATAAQRVYVAMAVDPDLRRKADDAAAQVQRLHSGLSLRDPDHVTKAEELRATPAGADRASWSAGADNARRDVARLRDEIERLDKLTGQLEANVRSASPTEPGRRMWATLSERWQPTDPDHGRTLETEAQKELRDAHARLEDATTTVSEVESFHEAALNAARDLREARLPLSALLGAISPSVTAEPYDGDVDSAMDMTNTAIDGLRRTREEVEKTRSSLGAAVQNLVTFASQKVYEPLHTQARRSIIESTPDLLAVRAAEWSGSLQARLATLTSDLDNVNRHRKAIVERLSALVDQAMRTLRLASRLSRLPADLAEWGGHPFLGIHFTEPDRTAIAVRVGEVVDRVAGEYAARSTGGNSRSARRDGMTLLLDSVHAAVPKGFTVDVLKPDSVLRDERVGIEEMNEVFSGGQELTAAIVLYCTLAALSANDRGQMRSRHSGVLFLDNPIGRANASYLIDLQQAVARALGVQLIYTTGISDDRVLAAFPLWVRLRNDADLRAGLKHIQVAEVVRSQLPVPYSADEVEGGSDGGNGHRSAPGTVTATRVHRHAPGSRPGSHERAVTP